VVLAVVLIAGSRLMYLSVQHHATAARATAATIVTAYVSKIEPEFPEARNAREPPGGRGQQGACRHQHVQITRFGAAGHMLLDDAEDRVLASRPTEAANASGIASEWSRRSLRARCRARPFSARCGWVASGC